MSDSKPPSPNSAASAILPRTHPETDSCAHAGSPDSLAQSQHLRSASSPSSSSRVLRRRCARLERHRAGHIEPVPVPRLQRHRRPVQRSGIHDATWAAAARPRGRRLAPGRGPVEKPRPPPRRPVKDTDPVASLAHIRTTSTATPSLLNGTTRSAVAARYSASSLPGVDTDGLGRSAVPVPQRGRAAGAPRRYESPADGTDAESPQAPAADSRTDSDALPISCIRSVETSSPVRVEGSPSSTKS